MSRLSSPGVEAAVLTRVRVLIVGVAVRAKACLAAVGTTVPVSPGQLR